jgi:hypothetical protein
MAIRTARLGVTALTLSVLLAGCSSDSGFMSGGGGGGSRAARGEIRDSSGNPIAGATLTGISGTTGTATSDAVGRFVFDWTGTTGSSATFEVRAPGFAPQIVKIPIKAGVTGYALPVTMSPLLEQAITNGSTGGSLTFQTRGVTYTATLPPGAVGTTGPVRLRVAGIEPADGPGALENVSGSTLQSGGMFYIELLDAAGNPVALLAGQSIQVTTSSLTLGVLAGTQPVTAFTFDEGAAAWSPDAQTMAQPDGVGTVAAVAMNVRPGQRWNVDRVYQSSCIRGTVANPSAANCGGTRVRGDGPTNSGLTSFDSSGADGTFCLSGAEAQDLSIFAGSSYVSVVPGVSVTGGGSCAVPASCVDVGALTIPDAECAEPAAPGGPSATYSENVIPTTGSCFACQIVITVTGAPPGASLTATSSWGGTASATANGAGGATFNLQTAEHCPCLSGTFTVFANGVQIFTETSTCF